MAFLNCPDCGVRVAHLRSHVCGSAPGKSRNTPEASGTARKAPSGPLSGGPSRHSPAVRTVAVKQRVMTAPETGRGEADHRSRLVQSQAKPDRKPAAGSVGRCEPMGSRPKAAPRAAAARRQGGLAGGAALRDGAAPTNSREASSAPNPSSRGSRPPASVPSVSAAKRGPGRPKIEGDRPWEVEGVSRRTWYRRQKN